jgi:hypothetical protein
VLSAWTYVYLAVSSGMLGVGILFVVLFVCQNFGIDIGTHLWLLAIPLALAVFLNVCFIELYRKLNRK